MIARAELIGVRHVDAADEADQLGVGGALGGRQVEAWGRAGSEATAQGAAQAADGDAHRGAPVGGGRWGRVGSSVALRDGAGTLVGEGVACAVLSAAG